MSLGTGGWIGGLLFTCTCVGLAAGAVFLPHDPLALDLDSLLAPPSGEHLLGTDQYGRDLASRMVAAGWLSLLVSAATVIVAVAFGVVLGGAAGYFGGWLDRILMLALDALMAFPALLLVLAFLSALGPQVGSTIVALGIAFSPTVARVVRSRVLALRDREFVQASRILGRGDVAVLWLRVLPNTLGPLIVTATTLFATALLLESALSFLGLGVPPPAATWGGLLSDSRDYLDRAPWLSIFPGLAITIVLLAINLLGDALRDLLDPRVDTR